MGFVVGGESNCCDVSCRVELKELKGETGASCSHLSLTAAQVGVGGLRIGGDGAGLELTAEELLV